MGKLGPDLEQAQRCGWVKSLLISYIVVKKGGNIWKIPLKQGKKWDKEIVGDD